MNIKRVLGAFAVGLVAVGTFTAQAADYNWTAGSGTDLNWSTADNWDPSGGPGTADQATFTTADQHTVKLDKDVTITKLSGDQKVIYNDDPSMTNTLTVTGAFLQMNTEAKGFVNVTTTGGDGYVKGTLKVSDGARMTLHKANFDDNGGQRFIASGAKSYMSVPCLWWNASGKNTGVSFESRDSAELSITPVKVGSSYRNPLDKISLKAVNANLYMNNYYSKITKAVDIYCEGCYMDINALQPATAGTSIAFVNGGMLRLRSETKLPNGNYASTLTLCDGCVLQQYDSKISLNSGLTIKLAPTLASSETDGLIATREGQTGHTITLNSGVKFEIDCTAFTNFYGKKTMMVIDQKQPKSTFTCNLPTAANVTLTGEGAANCSCEFYKDSTGKKLMLTITSRNIPAGTMAVIDGKAAYTSIQAAVDAAEAGETVTVVADVALADAVTFNKAAALDVGVFTVTTNADFAAAALLNVADGGSLTVTGSGAIDGGVNAAVAVTGGAFTSPTASTVTFASTASAVAVSEGTTVEICGGTFVSAEGDPVTSAVNGILMGGKYNKEPTATLIADGYKTEQVGDMWEVMLEGPAMCRVGDRLFASLQRAYAAVLDQGDIFIISNATVQTLTMDRNIEFWFDLDGHTLTPEEANGTIFDVRAGKVYLYDNTSGTKGALKGGVVVTAGTVAMNLAIDADPALTVNGGTVSASSKIDGSVVQNNGTLSFSGTVNGGVTLNNGTMTLTATANINAEDVAITAKGGTLNIAYDAKTNKYGTYTGGTSAFVADGIASNKCNIDAGSFSSEIPVAYLKNNRKMEQQGDRWVVVLASDESAVTYTWKNDASGAWTNKANWTASVVRNFGYPDQLDRATVAFPKTMAAGDEIVLDKSVSVLKVNWENTNPVKMVVDNAKLTLRSGLYNPYTKRPFEPGITGPVDFVIKGENPQIECQSEWSLGSFRFGSSNYVMNIKFELPVTPWSTQEKSPLYVKGTGNPVHFGTGVNFTIDAKNVVVPEAGTTVTNFLAYATDKGVRFDEWDWAAPHPRTFNVINAPEDAKCDLIAVWDKGLFFTVSRRPGMMFYVK